MGDRELVGGSVGGSLGGSVDCSVSRSVGGSVDGSVGGSVSGSLGATAGAAAICKAPPRLGTHWGSVLIKLRCAQPPAHIIVQNQATARSA